MEAEDRQLIQSAHGGKDSTFSQPSDVIMGAKEFAYQSTGAKTSQYREKRHKLECEPGREYGTS